MPRKKKVNAGKLIAAVESGESSKSIMAKFGIKTSPQLKALYLDALAEKGKVKGIVSRGSQNKKSAKSAKKAKTTKINKRGSLVIPRTMVEEMGFKSGQSFSVRKTKAGLSLRQS